MSWFALAFFYFAFDVRADSAAWRYAVFPSGASFTLEIAADDPARERGYMFREQVGAQEGMLFVFETSDLRPFWMKNCKVPLDIVWLDEKLHVVDIAHDQQPCPPGGECHNVFPMRVARYVLEVAGGTAEREGLERGDRIVLLTESPGS